MGTTLHQKEDKADGGRRGGDRSLHVRVEDLGLISSSPGTRQETHEFHDELKARWIRAEEEMRQVSSTSTSHRWTRQGRGEIPAGIVPCHMQRYHERKDGEADGIESNGGSW